MEPIRSERQTVRFFDGLTVDGFRMPNGDFRVGITSASLLLGYSRNWLFRILNGESRNLLKELQGLGFTEETVKTVTETIRGDREAQTISLRDFNRLISYAVFDKKKAALALQLALTELSLTDFFRDSFGEPPLSIDDKRRAFYEAYAQTISPEDWRRMDVEDIIRLALPGDEKPLRDGLWNQ
jgi:hypothetical protein